MNKGQLRTQASLFAEDPAQSRYATYYDAALNEANEMFALDSKCLFKDAPTITVVAGISTYSLPTDFMFEKEVTHKGIALTPITRARIQQFSSTDWTLDIGTPTKFIIDPEEARKLITLYPQPQSDDAGANLVLTYYPLPADLVADSDIPLNGSSLMNQFHVPIAAYAAWMILGYDSQTPEKMAKRNDLMKTYLGGVSDAIAKFGTTISAPWRMTGGKYWKRDF